MHSVNSYKMQRVAGSKQLNSTGKGAAVYFGAAVCLSDNERNKITEVLLRSVMKKGTLRSSAGAFVYYNRRSRRCAWVRPAG